MSRPFALCIAGFDPSGGAGILADIKTLEQHKIYGLGICSGITLQTENIFHSMHWEPLERVLEGIDFMLKNYPIKAIKIGILPNMNWLKSILQYIPKDIPIVWDPVLRASSGFEFMKKSEGIENILKKIHFLTPNTKEMDILISSQKNLEEKAAYLSTFTNLILKGGHREFKRGTDFWFKNGKIFLELNSSRGELPPKHGSGCIFSSALTAGLALGLDEEKAVRQAKDYVEKRLDSNPEMLAYHTI